MGKQETNIPFPRYSQKTVERYLGIRRQITDVNGANFHKHFLNFLKYGSIKTILYNAEDIVLMHLILNSLKNKLI
ncbi:ribonuclease H-like domain-containing protein [Candidatus Bathyarchaeota archaeon]|nr:ribonuclease H-like domain-containing protein [Candidatus Bathyarchaeota archaeon]